MVGVLSNKIRTDELKPGDHIYSWRHSYLYAHHGIYIGDGSVIHFTRGAGHEIGTGTVLDRFIFSSSPSSPSDSPCPRCGDQSKSDGVISSCLECFLSGGELYQFQYGVTPAVFLAKARGGTCTLARSDPPEDVLYRAEYLLENGFGGYNLFKNNCEDFAIYCKTGLLVFTAVSVGRSGQAASFLAAASAIVSSPLRFMTTGFAGLTAMGCGIYCISRIVSDIGVRRDVMKIPVERLVARPGLDEPGGATRTRKDEPEGATQSLKDEPVGATQSREDEPEGATQSLKDEPEGATQTRKDEPEGATQSLKDEPEGATQTPKDEPEGATQSLKDEPKGPTQTRKDEPEGATQSFKDEPEGATQTPKEQKSSDVVSNSHEWQSRYP